MLEPKDLFSLLSDETRLRCISLLYQEGELCVCEFTYALDLSQPKISRHLALLRKYNIVSDRRSGLWIYYKIHKNLPLWAKKVISEAVKAIKDRAPYTQDRKQLTIMLDRASCCN